MFIGTIYSVQLIQKIHLINKTVLKLQVNMPQETNGNFTVGGR